MYQRADYFLTAVPGLERPGGVAADLPFGPAQGREQHDYEQLARLRVQPAAAQIVAEAELGERLWHRLVEGRGQPGVTLLYLVPVERGLRRQPAFIALRRVPALLRQGQGDASFMAPMALSVFGKPMKGAHS